MFTAKTLAIAAFFLLIMSVLQQGWIGLCLASALLVVALYLGLVLERKAIRSPSFFSQLSLFAIGCLLILSAYLGIERVMDETKVEDLNLVIVIGGFILFPLLSLMGLAMAGCSIASKKASHEWLEYLAKKPKWVKNDFT